MQADSIVPHHGSPQSLNRYAYVLDNPLRYIDPTGYMIKSLFPGDGFGSCEDMNGDLICDSNLIDLLQPTPTNPYPTPTPTPTPAQDPSSTPTYEMTPTSTSSATLAPSATATPSTTPTPYMLVYPANTPGAPVVSDEIKQAILEEFECFLDGFSLVPGTAKHELFPHDWLTPLEQIPHPGVQGAVPMIRLGLHVTATLKNLYDLYESYVKPFFADPIYPLPYPVQQYPE
jgi:hypothetical protein